MKKIYSSYSINFMHLGRRSAPMFLCILILTTFFVQNAGARHPDTIHANVLSDGHGDRKQVVAEANCIRNRMSLPRTRSTHAGHPPPPPAEEHSCSATYGAETRLIPTGPNPLHN
ncbi:hypothetical protein QQ045_030838 [Rhodiola kirilowii]